MFAGTLFAVANNGEEDKKMERQENVTVSVIESKVIGNLDDDFCSISIERTVTTVTSTSTTIIASVATGTGATCAEAEANARRML